MKSNKQVKINTINKNSSNKLQKPNFIQVKNKNFKYNG